MPNDNLTEAIKEAYSACPSDVVVLETLQISHASLAEDIFLVKNNEDIVATLETSEEVTFTACGFRMSLPASGENGLQELTISIDNIDREISDFVNEAKTYKTPVSITYRPYLASDLTQPQMDPPLVLRLTDVRIGLMEVTGKANFADVINKGFLTSRYTRSRFPNLGSS